MEAVAPGERTYVRPSRRGADRTDVALPGRRREGWTMHLVLDTSGSMVDAFPEVLGAIASSCEALRVEQVHVLQCDVEVTRDEIVDVSRLLSFPFAGLGGSDLRPAMYRLARDPEVEAAIVITDGYIAYPEEPMPYAVLWAVTYPAFAPPYGKVVPITPRSG
jgi:predicted metal-dependent peptidase